MITPSLEKLLDKVDNKYTLVIATAKRAREIVARSGNNHDEEEKDQSIRAVSLALEDIAEGRVQVIPIEHNRR